MESPLVSVVIPTYKRSALLGRAIDSVLAQSHTHWELIVVDDNDEGTDYRRETERFMARYTGDPRIRYVKHQKNSKLPAARNTGIKHATGDYIAFLDDDDEWLPGKLEAQLACFARGGNKLALVYTGLKVVDGRNEVLKIVTPQVRGKVFARLLERNYVDTPSSVMCRRDALHAVGLFDETLPSAEDLDLYLRLAERYEIDFVAEPLTIYVKHDKGRMMENFANIIRAHDMLYDKYRPALTSNRKLHSHFLQKQGYFFTKAGDRRRAEAKFIRSLLADPLNRRSLRSLARLKLDSAPAIPLRALIGRWFKNG